MTPTPENAPPGTEIICIDATPGTWTGQQLTLGAIYTVQGHERAYFAEIPLPRFGLLLNEIDLGPYPLNLKIRLVFKPARFRLLHRAASPSFYVQHKELVE